MKTKKGRTGGVGVLAGFLGNVTTIVCVVLVDGVTDEGRVQ